MLRYPVLALTVILAFNVQAEVYRWVDSNGQVHYGDRQPPEGAEPVTLPGQRPGVVREQQQVAPEVPGESGTGSTDGVYTRLSILQPEPGSTLQGPSGVVAVSIALEPGLQEGHYLELTLDGRVVPGKLTKLATQMSGIERGPHEIVATVFNTQGEALVRSNSVRFYLRQSSPFEREGAEQDYQEWLTDTQREREAQIEQERREQEERFTRDLREQRERVEERRKSDFESKQEASPRFEQAYPKLPKTETGEEEKYSKERSDLEAPTRQQSEQRRGELKTYDPAKIPEKESGVSADFDAKQAPKSEPIKEYSREPNPAYAPTYTPPKSSD